MNQLARWMTRLYPHEWRARYGDELDALLADNGADARVVADLFQGGIRMQFSKWKFPKLAVVLGIVGWMIGMAVTYLPGPTYEATAALNIVPANVRATVPATVPAIVQPASAELTSSLMKTMQQFEAGVLSGDTLSQIAKNEGLPMSDAVDNMRRNIRIVLLPPGSASQKAPLQFLISFNYTDRQKARQVVLDLADAFLKLPVQEVKLEISDTSVLPVRLFRPGLYRHPIVGFLAGLLCAFVISMIHGGRNRPPISLMPQTPGTAA